MAKIVLIEDNPESRYLVTFIMQRAGHSVMSADDGQEGIALARRETPDLILLDIQLPGLDGYRVAEILRDDPEFPSIPIVGVSSFAMPGDRDRALAAGCADYIEKPIDPGQFVGRVEELLPR